MLYAIPIIAGAVLGALLGLYGSGFRGFFKHLGISLGVMEK